MVQMRFGRREAGRAQAEGYLSPLERGRESGLFARVSHPGTTRRGEKQAKSRGGSRESGAQVCGGQSEVKRGKMRYIESSVVY